MRLHIIRRSVRDLDSEIGSPFGNKHGSLNKLLGDAIDAKIVVPKTGKHDTGDTVYIIVLTHD